MGSYSFADGPSSADPATSNDSFPSEEKDGLNEKFLDELKRKLSGTGFISLCILDD